MTQGLGVPIVKVGKEGLTDAVVQETDRQLDKHGGIKVQFTRELAAGKAKNLLKRELAERLHAKVVHAAGFVVVLERKR